MIIIIGTGLAGYQLAKEFRKIDTLTPLMLITEDAGGFYSKPLLSTALTSGKTSESLVNATAEAMAEQLNAVIYTHSRVTAISPENQTITTGTEVFSYQKLVIACGAEVIKAPLTGNAIADVLSVNHIYHYAAFEQFIKNKQHVTILGAGLIGCEFANDLTNAGYQVSIVAPDKTPLERFVPDNIGRLLQQALEKNGVTFHLNCVAENVDKIDEKYCLTLSNQHQIQTDFVLSAIGLKPHTALATVANIQVNRGIVVNRYLETSSPHIYALGDCAEVEGHVLPFITPLLNCARALAKTLAGTRTAVDYPAMPVVVKTPAHPIVICPPPKQIHGNWQIEVYNNTVRALFYDENQQLQGFVLTNDAVKERMTLVKQIPGLF